MGEMDKIAEKVKLFPEHVQENVFAALHDVLLGGQEANLDPESGLATQSANSASAENGTVTQETVTQVWNGKGKVVELVNKHGLKDKPSIDLAALVAYVHSVLAPEQAKLETIGTSQFEDACVELGREIGNSTAALDNAKKAKYKYLQGGKREGYKLTNTGRIHVETKLLQANS